MVLKYTKDGILDPKELILGDEEQAIIDTIKDVSKSYKILMDDFKFSENLVKIWELVSMANKYIEKVMPWKLNSENNTKKLLTVLYNLCEVIRCVSVLITPFMPKTTKKIFFQLGISSEDLKCYSSVGFHDLDKLTNYEISKEKEILFPRIEKA